MYIITKVGEFYEVFNTKIKQTVYVSESYAKCFQMKQQMERSAR